MAINDQILIQKYNDIRNKVNIVLGTGASEYGYGNPTSTLEVRDGQAISATQWDFLRADITTAYKHQTGQSPTITDTYEGLSIQWAHALQYDQLADTLITNRDLIYTGATVGVYTQQATVANGGYQTQGPGWGSNENNQRYTQQQYLIYWSSSEEARFFFNSGGYIRLIHSLSYSVGSPNSKTTGWDSIINAMNDIQFTFNMINYRQGLAGATTIWFPNVPGRTDGQQHDTTNPYTENFGYQQFRWVNAKTIEVTVQLADQDSGDQQFAGTPIKAGIAGETVDETVQAYISSGLEYRVSTDQIVGETPTYTIANFIIAMYGGPAPPPPTYALTRSASTVNEGGSVVISLATTNIANSSLVPYTISGNNITVADFTGLASLYGSFTVSHNTAELTLTIAADVTTEGSETFVVTLDGIVPPVSTSVTISDTSVSVDPGPE